MFHLLPHDIFHVDVLHQIKAHWRSHRPAVGNNAQAPAKCAYISYEFDTDGSRLSAQEKAAKGVKGNLLTGKQANAVIERCLHSAGSYVSMAAAAFAVWNHNVCVGIWKYQVNYYALSSYLCCRYQ